MQRIKIKMNVDSLSPVITSRWCHSGNNKRSANIWNLWKLFLEQETMKQSTKSYKVDTEGKMNGTIEKSGEWSRKSDWC